MHGIKADTTSLLTDQEIAKTWQEMSNLSDITAIQVLRRAMHDNSGSLPYLIDQDVYIIGVIIEEIEHTRKIAEVL